MGIANKCRISMAIDLKYKARTRGALAVSGEGKVNVCEDGGGGEEEEEREGGV